MAFLIKEEKNQISFPLIYRSALLAFWLPSKNTSNFKSSSSERGLVQGEKNALENLLETRAVSSDHSAPHLLFCPECEILFQKVE